MTKGLPDPFVDSLTHDSIIVQIPRLHGQVNNRLDKVLSIFDQTRMDQHNKHVLDIDESAYTGDDEMIRIVNRLMAAAADAKMRHDMNVEDEYFSIIEKRETEVMLAKKELAETKAEMKEKDAQLEQKDAQLEQMDAQLEQMTRNSIVALLKSGMTPKAIAEALGVDAGLVSRIAENQ